MAPNLILLLWGAVGVVQNPVLQRKQAHHGLENTTEYIFLLEMVSVSASAHSAGAYTATLLVMVNVLKGGGRAPPTLTSMG